MVRVAFYVRVSTERQQQRQTIEQQVNQLRAYVAAQDSWVVDETQVFRDDGCSGAHLNRPGLDALRDQAARGAFELVLVTAPDRLARNLVQQMVVLDHLERLGVPVVFLDRPPVTDPHEQLVVQIRGAVAEYERTLIADRMRRGRLAKLRSGRMLPWSRPPYGYRVDAERPRDPAGVRVDAAEAAVVAELFATYAAGGVTLHRLARQLMVRRVPAPKGGTRWTVSTVRWILRNPSYRGQAASERYANVPARERVSPLRPLGAGRSTRPRAPTEWITVPVPAIVSDEQFAQVQERLVSNRREARRSTTHEYLLRGLLNCGHCALRCTGQARSVGTTTYRYYVCGGKHPAAGREPRCPARSSPGEVLDALVWDDLCAVLQQPELITLALERAHSGAWLADDQRRRQTRLREAQTQVQRQQARLLDAYLAGVIALPVFAHKERELGDQQTDLAAQERALIAEGQRQVEVTAIARSTAAVCERLRQGLAEATFAQRRQLVELLIDCVVVHDDSVEIRYVIPTTEASTHTRFCHLRSNYFSAGCRVQTQRHYPTK